MRVRIEKLVYGGEGLAHSDGTTVFAPYVLPGEEVEVTAAKHGKKFARCHLQSVLTPSSERIEPVCPHYGVCGGCNYQHISYQAQLRFKEEILRETLRRLGRLDWAGPITLHASPPFGYRNRAQWKIRPLENRSHKPLERSGDGQSLGVGYFRSGSSVLCPVETCSVISPRLASVLDILRCSLADRSLPEEIQEVEAFADAEDQKLLLNVSCSSMRKIKKTLFEELSHKIAGIESVLLRESRGESMELKGPGFLHYRVGDKRFRVGHLSFFQVNRHVLEEMARTITTAAGSGKLVFDLYAGVGLLSAFLAENFAAVAAVESDPAAARDLEVNAAASGKNISSHNQSAETFLSQWRRQQGAKSPDVIVVDPPRAGLESGALRALLDVSAPRILYVSCDPSTLARDLAQLCSKVYKAGEIHLFDMFPQTYHIESLVCLEHAS